MYKIHKRTQYDKIVSVIIKENDDGSVTSFGEYPENSDYQAYLEWLEKGNTPELLDETTK